MRLRTVFHASELLPVCLVLTFALKILQSALCSLHCKYARLPKIPATGRRQKCVFGNDKACRAAHTAGGGKNLRLHVASDLRRRARGRQPAPEVGIKLARRLLQRARRIHLSTEAVINVAAWLNVTRGDQEALGPRFNFRNFVSPSENLNPRRRWPASGHGLHLTNAALRR